MSIRTERIAKLIQREIAGLLQTEFHEASHTLLTVTEVRVTRDLSIADVYLSVLGGTPELQQAGFQRVVQQTVEIRQALARRIRHQLRTIPELRFHHDQSQDYAERMENLFAQIDPPPASSEDDA